MLSKCLEVSLGPISEMLSKSIARMLLIQPVHQSISGHLCKNGGRRDCIDEAIPANVCLGLPGPVLWDNIAARVDRSIHLDPQLGSGIMIPTDHKLARPHRAGHGHAGCHQYIVLIDLIDTCPANAKGRGTTLNLWLEDCSPARTQTFGVRQPPVLRDPGEAHSRRADWASQRAPACLVHPDVPGHHLVINSDRRFPTRAAADCRKA
jgi:hypothetical protein